MGDKNLETFADQSSGIKVCVGGGGGGRWLRVNLVLHFGPNLWVGLWDLALDQAEQL